MSKRRSEKREPSGYNPVFTPNEAKLMVDQDVRTLDDDIGITRVMVLRTFEKMNEVREELSFRDHLDALRTVAYASGHIASMIQVREVLFRPYEQLQKQIQQVVEDLRNASDELGEKVFGMEQWAEIRWKADHGKLEAKDLEFLKPRKPGKEMLQ